MTDWNQFNPRPKGTYPCDTRRFCHGRVQFVPEGPVYAVGDGRKLQQNAFKRVGAVPLTARLFVGLNVGGTPTYSVDDVVRITRRVREAQGEAPDSSFLLQRGIFTGRGGVVEEDSVQVIIFDFGGGRDKFEAEMVELAETLLSELQQETIYVEMQERGIAYDVFEVTP